MTRIFTILLLISLIVAGCSGGNDDDSRQVPTEMGTAQQSDAVTDNSPSNTSPPSSDTPTITPTFTDAPTLIPTATSTPDVTLAFERTLTAIKEQTPIIATLTPIAIESVDDVVLEVPVVAADIIITEVQYQTAIDNLLANFASIQSATVDFRDTQEVVVRMSASGGQAMTTGEVTLGFVVSGGLVAIPVTNVNVGGAQPPQPFADVIQDELLPLITDALDAAIEQQLGEQHDLENMTITEDRMEIMLLIPAS